MKELSVAALNYDITNFRLYKVKGMIDAVRHLKPSLEMSEALQKLKDVKEARAAGKALDATGRFESEFVQELKFSVVKPKRPTVKDLSFAGLSKGKNGFAQPYFIFLLSNCQL